MRLAIEGESGVYGSFLVRSISRHYPIVDGDADTVILAVPYDSYEEVCAKHQGKHLINVCSIQKDSTDICLKYSDKVTSIHTLYGPNSPAEDRYAVITYNGIYSEKILSVFKECFRHSDRYLSPLEHDKLMSKVHKPVISMLASMRSLVDEVKDIPLELLPTSMKKLISFMETSRDMPEGTTTSILANRY